MAVALQKYLVFDESKFNRLRPALFAKVDAFEAMITENGVRPVPAAEPEGRAARV